MIGSARRVLAALAAGALLALVAAPGAAVAESGDSAGSVPLEVRDFVRDDLVDRLDRFYGDDAAGQGLDASEAEPDGIHRVWWLAEAWFEDPATEPPTVLANAWVVPVRVGDGRPGYAIVWIDPDVEAPELAGFAADPDAAEAIAGMPEAAQLIEVPEAGAWLALDDDGTLSALRSGGSGIAAPVAIDEARVERPDGAATPPGTVDPSGAVVAAVLLLLIVVAALLIMRGRRFARGPRTG
ncbi:hypothetical protein [Homoserinibacter sp. YIM 151385]|uniref:hypothetical protein n=1 Tax=Homoserinibacter sp. YIM 151385 TaxID=2985506 RepID=UPI0022F03322|nr:hypothetical protein [Homoserinibacter sp. YIM 151385]WBU36933.1 hypothetical protein OF852_08305 [Homoserinibacter sp. YIM 151385]